MSTESYFDIFDKVHIFWGGHKISRNLHLTFDRHYIRWRFLKILWPPQNIWTLKILHTLWRESRLRQVWVHVVPFYQNFLRRSEKILKVFVKLENKLFGNLLLAHPVLGSFLRPWYAWVRWIYCCYSSKSIGKKLAKRTSVQCGV